MPNASNRPPRGRSARPATPALLEALEGRALLSAAFDLIGLSALRADPAYAGLDGSGVTVAVLDTGLDGSHPLLVDAYRAGFDAVYNTGIPTDREHHGTHVAGIVAARDAEIGVALGAGLVGVKVLSDSGSGTTTDIAEGLRWVLEHRVEFNIVAVNMSLGSGFYTSASQVSGDAVVRQIRLLEGAGITVVSSGGNSYKNHEFPNFASPGVASTLAVGAVWQDGLYRGVRWGDGAIDLTTGPDRLTSFSQRLDAPNAIFAPGAIIRSTIPGGGLDEMGGTSQAAPMVAGAVAILQEAAQRFAGRLLTPAEVVTTLRSSADSIFDGDDENDNVQNTNRSYLRLNIYRAVTALRERFAPGSPTTPEGPPAAAFLDPNAAFTGAAVVSTALDGSGGSTLTGEIGRDGTTLLDGRDIDLYRVEVTAAGASSFGVAFRGAAFDATVRLFDAGGAPLALSNPAGVGAPILSVALQPGTYFVGVSAGANAAYPGTATDGAGSVAGATGVYELTLALTNSDPNGLLAGAVLVELGTDLAPLTFEGFIGADLGRPVGTADVDLFRIEVPDDGTLLIDLDTPVADGYVDTFLIVFDASGTLIDFSDDTAATDAAGRAVERASGGLTVDVATGAAVGHFTDSFLRLRVARGGVYYIGISDYQNRAYDPRTLEGRRPDGPGGTYILEVRFASGDLNGSIGQALAQPAVPFPLRVPGRIGADGDATGALLDVGDKDVDFLRIRVSQAGIVEIDVDSFALRGNRDAVDTVLSLYDAVGTLLGTNDDADGLDPSLQFRAEPGRDYLVAVSGFGNDAFDPFAPGSGTPGDTGAYEISARLVKSKDLKKYSDDALGFSRVRVLNPGDAAQGVLGVDGAFIAGSNDVDLYKITPRSAGFLTVTADGLDAFSADTTLRLFDSKGRELAFNDDRDDATSGSRVGVTVQKGKTYYIGVAGAGEDPRRYDPKNAGSGRPGSTGSYSIATSLNAAPTFSKIADLRAATPGEAFEITWEALAAAGNEADAERDHLNFIITGVLSGSATRNGAPVVPGVTRIAPGESVLWTPASNAKGTARALNVVATDGLQTSGKAVRVNVAINTRPTLGRIGEVAVGPAFDQSTTFGLPFDLLAGSADEADRDRSDVLSFRITEVLAGTFSIDGIAAVPGSLLRRGGSLTWAPGLPGGFVGAVPALRIVAFDGRAASLTPVTVTLRVG